jgi:hypothetical protein
MNEGTHGDLLVAICTIAGAVIGVVGTLLVEYFRRERKAVRFVLQAPEDLAAALRSHGNSFELKVNDVATQTLIAAGVTVQNTGNVIITDLMFDVGIPGKHILAQAQAVSENKKLVAAVQIDEAVNPVLGLEEQPFFKISLPFFNPGETFKIATFYDGEITPCTIDCRLPGVKIKTATEEDVRRRIAAIEELGSFVSKTTGAGFAAGVGAGLLGALAAILSH